MSSTGTTATPFKFAGGEGYQTDPGSGLGCEPARENGFGAGLMVTGEPAPRPERSYPTRQVRPPGGM